MRRTAREVAARALIFGTLNFRASLEVTEHPRTVELCSRLLPWLLQQPIGVPIEDSHREILQCPRGSLAPDFESEATARGECALVLGWCIQLFDTPDRVSRADPGLLLRNLRILQPDASQVLAGATLRPQVEIDEYFAFCLEVRHQFRLLKASPEARVIWERMHRECVARFGFGPGLRAPKVREIEAAELASTSPSARPLYSVRANEANWLFGDDE
jgi:hypothetical protein